MTIAIIVASILLLEAAVVAAITILLSRRSRRRSIKAAQVRRRDIAGDIYEIADPDTGVVVYVGKSTLVEKEIEAYIRSATSTGVLLLWLADKIQQGKKPIVRTVAHGNNRNELNQLEQNRINTYIASGVILLNRQISSPSA